MKAWTWLRSMARRTLPAPIRLRASAWLRGRPSRTQIARDGKPVVIEWTYEPAWKVGLATAIGAIALTSIVVIPACQGFIFRSRLPDRELPLYVNEVSRTVLQFWGGVVVIGGLYFAWQRMLATEETNRIERERHATERFANAVEKLGHLDIAVRSGAIYTLERFAMETPQMSWTVTEILNRFVRGRTLEQKLFQDDVQTALTVMGRRPWAHREQGHHRIDFSGLQLAGYDLSRGRFTRCVAKGAMFAGARLYGADMHDADLRGANFVRADARGLNISNANANFTVWVEAQMGGLSATQAHLKRADLRKTFANYGNWRAALLDRANCQFATLKRVQLQSARFHCAILDDVIFDDSNLSSADLSGASLARTSLVSVALEGARLRKADLSTARGTDQRQLASAHADETTKLPGYGDEQLTV